MKLTKYLVIAMGAVAVLATIAWFLRDNLIERLSNPVLKDYGLAIVDVSLDALATSDATIGYLELRHEKGTSVVIEDLTLPYAAASKKRKTYRAKRVSIITATRTDGAAFDIAELLAQALSLPANFANSIVSVDEFSLSPYPTIRNVRWEISDAAQQLQARVDTVDMSARLTQSDPASYEVVFSLLSAPGNGNVLNARLQEVDAHYSLKGDGVLDLPAWQALARLVGIVPPEVELLSGTAAMTFDAEIPEDPLQTPTFSAELLPSSPLELTYRDSDGDIAAVHFQSDADIRVSATFPDVDWSLELARATTTVSYGDWKGVPVSLSEVTCETGPTCSMSTLVAVSDAGLPVGTVALAELSSAESVRFLDTGLRIDVQPGASLKIKDLASDAVALKQIQAGLVSGATLNLSDTGWSVTADSVDVKIDTLSTGEATTVSMPLFLENISAERNLDTLSLVGGVFASSSRATWQDTTLALPGVRGRVSQNGGDVVAELKTVGLHRDATIIARHSLASGAGNASVGEAAISFGKQHLSRWVSPWPRNLDIVAGTLSFDLSADWVQTGAGFAFTAEADVSADNLAGYSGEYAFTGLSTDIRARHQQGVGVTAEPSRITVGLIDVGVPLEKISADYSVDMNTLVADVTNLSMSVFGGTITADPFSFRTGGDANTVVLNTETLDLAELLSLKGFEALQVTGSVNARLPVTIEDETVTIANGHLSGNAPGGVIRYRQDKPPGKADTSGLGFAKRVLSNFEYTTLASDVNLGKEGDLTLKLKLTGRNPDMEEKRPVVLNVDVENNIPQMLRSLRAARAVEDVLEKRLAK